MAKITDIPLIERAKTYQERLAVIADEGQFTYKQLLHTSGQVATQLLKNQTDANDLNDSNDLNDLNEARVAFLTPRGFTYVAIQWGIWRAGGIAVPLCEVHPPPEMAYVIKDSAATIVIAHPDFEAKLRPIAAEQGVRFILTSQLFNSPVGPLPPLTLERRAMILYTSGTTGKPKGVVSTHKNIQSQITTLVSAWGWTAEDYILNILPLHHVHGIINVLLCALWAGAKCEIHPKFEAEAVWSRLASGELTLFMAVPTIYARLISYWQEASPDQQDRLRVGCAQLRLMISGSAALPVSRLEQWQTISGHILLERYGMTEIGMALSNPLQGERVPGHVGKPLPGVITRVVDENNNVVEPGTAGELQVKGPNVFLEYFRKPEATKAAFHEGWFLTGDTVVVNDQGVYRILGRNSVDIIKTGGYKVSALEIEEVLRTHPDIQECAVVGVEDPDWGERVCTALILKTNKSLTLKALRAWCKTQLAPYKIPSRMYILDELPRNVMGKVTKPEVAALFKP